MDESGKSESTTLTGAPAPGRFHSLDALRGFAMLLGVLLHAALPYMALDLGWPGRGDHSRLSFDIFVGMVHGFRMQLFFLVAGFFAHLLYHRTGENAFIRHRLKRIGVPFLAGMIVLMPVWRVLWDSALAWHAPAHLWFLQYLLIFYAATVVVLRGLRPVLTEGGLQRADRIFGALVRSFWKPLVLAVPTVGILIWSPLWLAVEKSGASVLPTWPGLLYYALFYAMGWCLHRQPHLLESCARQAGRYLLLAVPAFLVAGALVRYGAGMGEHPRLNSIKLFCDIAFALYTWFMVLGVTGVFVRFVNVPHPAIRYLADASYWIYLAHLPVVMTLQILLQSYAWDVLVKFAAICAVTLLVLLGSYRTFVRYSLIGAILNGPRQRPGGIPGGAHST